MKYFSFRSLHCMVIVVFLILNVDGFSQPRQFEAKPLFLEDREMIGMSATTECGIYIISKTSDDKKIYIQKYGGDSIVSTASAPLASPFDYNIKGTFETAACVRDRLVMFGLYTHGAKDYGMYMQPLNPNGTLDGDMKILTTVKADRVSGLDYTYVKSLTAEYRVAVSFSPDSGMVLVWCVTGKPGLEKIMAGVFYAASGNVLWGELLTLPYKQRARFTHPQLAVSNDGDIAISGIMRNVYIDNKLHKNASVVFRYDHGLKKIRGTVLSQENQVVSSPDIRFTSDGSLRLRGIYQTRKSELPTGYYDMTLDSGLNVRDNNLHAFREPVQGKFISDSPLDYEIIGESVLANGKKVLVAEDREQPYTEDHYRFGLLLMMVLNEDGSVNKVQTVDKEVWTSATHSAKLIQNGDETLVVFYDVAANRFLTDRTKIKPYKLSNPVSGFNATEYVFAKVASDGTFSKDGFINLQSQPETQTMYVIPSTLTRLSNGKFVILADGWPSTISIGPISVTQQQAKTSLVFLDL